MKNSSALLKIMLTCVVFFIFGFFFFIKPQQIDTANLTSASATMSNSRLSFLGKAVSAPNGAIGIGMTGSSYIDDDATHLFPGDTLFVGATNNSYTVETIGTGMTYFTLSSGLSNAISNNTDIWVKQTSRITISATLATTIPADGYVRVTFPDPSSTGNDQVPNSENRSTNGFDLNGLGVGNTGYFDTTGGSGCTWNGSTGKTLTAGSGSGHTFKQITTTACNGGTLTITLGSTTPTTQLLNPAPAQDRSGKGTGDVYTITVATFDASDTQIDTVDTKVAVIEGVLVSATVDATLGFTVAGVGSTTACGQSTDITTSAYSVPWGTISDNNTFHDAAQLLTVNTNADNGYSVTIQENDQMKRDGATCTGGNQSEASSCIKNTTCDGGTCTASLAVGWTGASTNGFGYSMQNVSGSDAAFTYTDNGGFAARSFPDMADSASAQSIMSSTAPVNGSAAWVCYRLNVSAIQPAGYYQNIVKFIATPTF